MNITLIGMPASGKSTFGKMLANKLSMKFLDLDDVILEKYKKSLKTLIEERGISGFLELEEEVACSINVKNTVIAPGGSICYEEKALSHLRKISKVIYLDVSYDDMMKRIGDPVKRGVTIPKGYTMLDLYKERTALYKKNAHISVDERGKTYQEIVRSIEKGIRKSL